MGHRTTTTRSHKIHSELGSSLISQQLLGPSEVCIPAGCLWLTPVIPAAWEAEVRKINVLGHPEQKPTRPHLNQWLSIVVCACHPRYMGKTNKRIVVQAERETLPQK
jgi:hypothetical protein